FRRSLQNPGVFATTPMLGFRPSIFCRRNAGKRARKDFKTIAIPDAVDDVVLQPLGLFASGETERLHTIFDRLRNEAVRRSSDFDSDFVPKLFVAGIFQKSFSSQHSELEAFRLFENHFPLIQISKPVSLDSRQDWGLAEIESDDGV